METPLDLNKKQKANLNEGLKAAIIAKEGSDSPATFAAGLSASVGSLGGGDNAYDFTQGAFGGGMVANTARRLAAMNKQRRLPNGVMNAAQVPPTTVGSEDPLNDFSGQKFELTPVQMKNENYTPGNEQGNARPLFTNSTKQMADKYFGKSIPGTFDSALPKKKCNKKY